MLRLYYNKRCERPCSVDEGTQATEQTFKCVSINARCLTSEPKLPPGGTRETSPVFCIVFPKGKLFVEPGGDYAMITE
jgi:hypothetical protein